MTFTTAALIVTWAAILLLALGLAGIVRQLDVLTAAQRYRPSATRLPIGLLAPQLDGIAFGSLDRATLLLFVDSGCPACDGLLAAHRQLLSLGRDHDVEVIPVFRGVAQEPSADGLRIIAHAGRAFESFHIPAAPFAVLVDRAGVVAGAAPVASVEGLRQFLAPAIEGMVRE